MGNSADRGSSPTAQGNHFSCSFAALLMARMHAFGGEDAVRKLLHEAGSERSPEYLLDTSNWISYDEAVALWRAGARITRHPQFARALGEEAGRRLNGSPVANLLRSLGSPEEVYRQMATTSTKFSTVTNLEAVDVGPGFAEIVAVAVDGFPRDADHCAWTCGLLTQAPVLFGLAPAIVEHDECAVLGAPQCRYRVIWDVDAATATGDSSAQVQTLSDQLEAMKERLQSMFATAADLIGAGGIGEVLARITDRAAVEVRAPRHLLAVRTSPGGELHLHHRGFPEDEVEAYAARILKEDPADLPESWLVVPVRSNRNDYGASVGRAAFPTDAKDAEGLLRAADAAMFETKRRHHELAPELVRSR
jgi:hypothetical protein